MNPAQEPDADDSSQTKGGGRRRIRIQRIEDNRSRQVTTQINLMPSTRADTTTHNHDSRVPSANTIHISVFLLRSLQYVKVTFLKRKNGLLKKAYEVR